MEGDESERDPDVAVEEALVGRPRGGVVVEARPPDVPAVTLRRRVIQREQQWPGRGQPTQDALEEVGGRQRRVPAEGAEEVVVGGEGVADAGRTEPGRDCPAALGEEGAEQQDGQAPGRASVEEGGHAAGEVLPERRQQVKIHGGSPGWDQGRVATPILAREPPSRQYVVPGRPTGDC